MKRLILPLISSIVVLNNSAVHAGGGLSRLVPFEGAYPIIRNRISVKPNWQMTELSKKYGTLRSTVGSKPTKPMPEKPFYEEMPKKVRFLDDQHEIYVHPMGKVKETSKESLPNVEKKNASTTIFTPQKKS